MNATRERGPDVDYAETALTTSARATQEIDAGHAIEAVAIPIVEERAHIGKREVDGDRLRVTTHTDLVEEHVSEMLRTDAVQVTRVPVNRTLTAGEAAPALRTEGNVTIIPVIEEIAVVEKRFVLREEIHILREVTTETVEVPVMLRKQRAVIDRTSADGKSIDGNIIDGKTVGDSEGDHHGLT